MSVYDLLEDEIRQTMLEPQAMRFVSPDDAFGSAQQAVSDTIPEIPRFAPPPRRSLVDQLAMLISRLPGPGGVIRNPVARFADAGLRVASGLRSQTLAETETRRREENEREASLANLRQSEKNRRNAGRVQLKLEEERARLKALADENGRVAWTHPITGKTHMLSVDNYLTFSRMVPYVVNGTKTLVSPGELSALQNVGRGAGTSKPGSMTAVSKEQVEQLDRVYGRRVDRIAAKLRSHEDALAGNRSFQASQTGEAGATLDRDATFRSREVERLRAELQKVEDEWDEKRAGMLGTGKAAVTSEPKPAPRGDRSARLKGDLEAAAGGPIGSRRQLQQLLSTVNSAGVTVAQHLAKKGYTEAEIWDAFFPDGGSGATLHAGGR